MQPNRRGGNNWFGGIIFVVLVFGSRFLPPVAAWLTQVTGLPISTPLLIGAIVVLSVVGPMLGSLVRRAGRLNRGNETSLPTGPMPVTTQKQLQSPTPQPTRLPPSALNLPQAKVPSMSSQQMPGAPRFEPIIDPRIVAAGVVGLVVLGGIFFGVLLLSGAL